jgi:hypothetical protein
MKDFADQFHSGAQSSMRLSAKNCFVEAVARHEEIRRLRSRSATVSGNEILAVLRKVERTPADDYRARCIRHSELVFEKKTDLSQLVNFRT